MQQSRSWKTAARIVVGAAFFMPGALLANPASAAPLENFLSPFPSCTFAQDDAPFSRFMSSVAARYNNPHSGQPAPAADRTEVMIEVPKDVADSIGPFTTRNEGEYTSVDAELRGTFQGMKVRSLKILLGNENGINSAALVFDADPAAVRKAFGAAVARGDAAGRAEERTHGVGYSASIPAEGPGLIVCDWST